jgi:4-hydroxy 2-oxovalerate aldolase
MKIIDCTFRDGGYQTNWHFEAKTVDKYFEAMEKSEIEYLEIGFKFSNRNNSFGPFAFVDRDFISSLVISPKFRIGVMINISDFISNNILDKNLLKQSFLHEFGYIYFIRIATLSSNLLHVNEASEILKSMGFEIHVNLMQISELDSISIDKFCKNLDKEINYLTIADTFGSLIPKDVIRIYEIVRNSSPIEMGLHAHDNCGLALANSLAAVDIGFSFVDSTVSGIGRAAGNLRTEFIKVLSDQDNPNTLLENGLLLDLSHNNFEKLSSKKNWGPSAVYFTGAQLKIHPNTLMSISKDVSESETSVLPLFAGVHAGVNQVSSTKNLDKVGEAVVDSSSPSPQLMEGFVKGFKVYLLGNGPFLKEFKVSLEDKLRKLNSNFVVIATTIEPLIDIHLINYFSIYDPQKFYYLYSQNSSYYEEVFKASGAKIISKDDLSNNGSKNIFLKYSLDEFQSMHDFTSSLHYALSVINFGDPAEVHLLGFDGYANDTTRHAEVQSCLKLFLGNNKLGDRLFSGTPTLYDIPTKSIYGS